MSAIDPGMEEPIARTAEEMKDEEEDAQEESEDDYRAPSKWWFASTICPLLAATFGPIANGFSICALVAKWRSYIPPGLHQASGKSIPDPGWLVAVNAVSLAFALTGNGALLLNMAQRLRFNIAQPLTIAGYFFAGVLLIADMAALTSSPTYFLTTQPDIQSHALSGAFYYAIWAAGIYLIIATLCSVTVFGAWRGHFTSGFNLTPAQRTLMLQTMMYIGYQLLGALVFSKIEGWKYLDGVYWAQVTLLTIGLGDYAPTHQVSRGLLFPYAIVGVLMVGLVVGSIRTLVLERGKEKIAARITEKRRQTAVANVDDYKKTIRISWFAQADFSTDPSLTPAQRREEEFNVMRKVQEAAERERRYFSLSLSLFFALMLWFVGAAIFMVCEQNEQGWDYFEALYFTFVVLMTIGYGDITPTSNAGKAFFVFWSLLAVPSLTVLISNMGDTFVKWFQDLTNWVASFTVLPEKRRESFLRARLAKILPHRWQDKQSEDAPQEMNPDDHHSAMLQQFSDRLSRHVSQKDLKEYTGSNESPSDNHFYHYVLSRELRDLRKHAAESPPRQYSWHDWEYYLKLMGNEEDPEDFEGQQIPDLLAPDALLAQHGDLSANGNVDRHTEKKHLVKSPDSDDWSWLSDQSPLMTSGSEAEWILERLSAALVRELNALHKGVARKAPISMKQIVRKDG